MGLMRADPAIVPEAEVIQYATFEETRELGGFKLEKDSIVPLMEKYIPLMVRSAREPDVKGTTIVCDRIPDEDEYILGVTKQEGFYRLRLKKIGVDEEIGFGAKALDVLAEMKIPYKHFPVVTDLATLIVHEDHLKGDGKLQDVNNALRRRTGAEVVRESKIDTIVVAGVGMQKHPDTNARIFGALGRAGIPQLMIDASTPVSIAIGVPEGSGDNAVRAVYNEFYGKK
jgi:aspartate kinase